MWGLAPSIVVVIVFMTVLVGPSHAVSGASPMVYLGESRPLPDLIAAQLDNPQGNGADGHIQEDDDDDDDYDNEDKGKSKSKSKGKGEGKDRSPRASKTPQPSLARRRGRSRHRRRHLHEDDHAHDMRSAGNDTSFAVPSGVYRHGKRAAGTVLTPRANFEGPGLGIAGYVIDGAPPDTTLAVGPNHIVAWVNSQFAVFDKTGTTLAGPTNGNTLWNSAGGLCETTNRGDPILQYDKLADRWIMSQFAFAFSGSVDPPYLQCIAVSTTASPLGSYHRYSVLFADFNDFGKIGVWPTAYFFSFNMFQGGTTNNGVALCAAERVKMLAGDPAPSFLCAATAFYGGGASFLPADLDGTTPPSDLTQGGIFVRQNVSPSLVIKKLNPNFAAGTVTLSPDISVALPATQRACGSSGGICIAQPSTTNLLDTLGSRLNYRAAYRNRGGVESLVVCQSVDPDGAGSIQSALRVYEIRSPLAAMPTLFQSTNYVPDASNRWMGSVAMNKFGHILAGYSIINVGAGLRASLSVAGRLDSDPINTLQPELRMHTGTGSQTGTLTRWGDYTTMQVDPVDDATFWYIGQYLAVDGTFNWQTRIASFTFVTTTATTLVSSVNPSTVGQAVTFTATVSATVPPLGATGTVAFMDGATLLGTVPLSTGLTAALTTAALSLGAHPITAIYSGDSSFTTSTSSPVAQQVNAAPGVIETE